MDRITHSDIIKSFAKDAQNDSAHEINDYGPIESMYREEHRVLNYYDIIRPENYDEVLIPGAVIRYSDRIDKISSILQIIDVKCGNGNKILNLRVGKQNKDHTIDSRNIWNIYPDHYYLFLYRSKHNDICNNPVIVDTKLDHPSRQTRPMQHKQNRRSGRSRQSGQSGRSRQGRPSLAQKLNQNTLDLDALMKHDPSIRSRIIHVNSNPNPSPARDQHLRIDENLYDDCLRDDHHYSKIKKIDSLLDDSESSDGETDGDNGQSERNRGKNASVDSVDSVGSRHNWNVEIKPNSRPGLDNILQKRKDNSRRGHKIRLTEEELSML